MIHPEQAREAMQKLIHSGLSVQLQFRRLQQCHAQASANGKSSEAGDLLEVWCVGSLGPRAKSGGPPVGPGTGSLRQEFLAESISTVFYFLYQPQLVLVAVVVLDFQVTKLS